MKKIAIIQHGLDGMGHQLHGLLSLLALHNINNYYFDGHAFINKFFNFDHLNQEDSINVKEYLKEIEKGFVKVNNQEKINYERTIHSHVLGNIPNDASSDTLYSLDNCYCFDEIPINENEYKKYIKNIEKIKKLKFKKIYVDKDIYFFLRKRLKNLRQKNSIYLAKYDKKMFNSVTTAIVKPGLGIVRDCLSESIKIVIPKINFNDEFKNLSLIHI